MAENEIQIPEFTAQVFREKRTKYCLLIPLFNEGQRYFEQVEKMQKAGVFDMADVIICDAGSKDGTTATDFLTKTGHRALLTRHGKGRQSTDIRMGYWWAVQEGYEGFITVDGNNKDGVEALPEFLEKLDEGYDYVQGSRFMKGGKAVNTPPVRYFALKLINEPVMSIAARRHLTDTTNGFKAFSRKFLLDPRVLPFRDIFYGYELIYYLPVRACRLGFKVTEVPVVRAYPKGEVPSKIGGIKGNIYQLSMLWHALLNHYDPGNESKLPKR